MTSKKFAAALDNLGTSQRAFAAAIDVNERTVRNWVSGRSIVPTYIAALVHLMLDTNTSVDQLKG